MLTEGKKSSIGEAVDKLIKLDSIGMMIIMSNATVLLARQEMEESRSNQQKEVSQITVLPILWWIAPKSTLFLPLPKCCQKVRHSLSSVPAESKP